VVGLALLLFITGAAAIVAVDRTGEARSQAHVASLQKRLAASDHLLLTQFNRSAGRADLYLLVGLQALRFFDTDEARGAVLTALQRRPGLVGVVQGQEGESHVAFSPDGRFLASAGDGVVVLWDLVRHRLLGRLRTDDTDYTDDEVVGFSRDGRRVWVTQFDRRAFEWSVPKGRLVAKIKLPEAGSDYMPTMNADATIVAAPERHTGRIGFWSMRTGRRVQTALPTNFARSASAVVFSSDGRLLLTVGGSSGRTGVWNVRSGRRIGVIDAPAWAFSADGRRVVALARDGLTVWDVRTLRQVGRAIPYSGDASVALSANGKMLAVDRPNNAILLWEVDQHRVRPPLRPQFGGGWRDLAFSADGRTFASQDEDGQVLLWDVVEPRGLARVIADPGNLGGDSGSGMILSYSPDGRTLAAADDSRVVLWDTGSWKVAHRLRKRTFIGFASDGALLFAQPRRLVYTDPAGRPRGVLPLRHILHHIWTLSTNGRMLAQESAGELTVWDLAGRRMLWHARPTRRSEITALVISGDGRTVAAGDGSGQIHIFNHAGDVVARVAPHGNVFIDSLALDGSGAVLAIGGDPLTVWDVRRDQLISNPEAHNSSKVIFSPRGALLAADSDADHALLLDGSSGRPIGKLEVDAGHHSGESAIPVALAFAPEGQSLAQLSSDPTRIIVWDTSTSSWERRACNLVRRNFTRGEWNLLVGPDKPYEPACPGFVSQR
jgi:WD40 repeat protein